MKFVRCGLVLAALVWGIGVQAQDITLTSRDGSLELSGTLQGYDGEFFRILTVYGPLTVDGQAVKCDGPACPDLTAPKAVIRCSRLRWSMSRIASQAAT